MKFTFLVPIFLATAAAEIKTLELVGNHRLLRRTKRGIGNPKAKPTGKDLGQLTFDHWNWNICGGDGDGGKSFAFFDPDCPGQVDVPRKWTFFAGGIDDSDNRSCMASKKNFILIPIVNTITWDDELDECDDECLEALLEGIRFEGEVTKATVDGKDAKVLTLEGTTESYAGTCPDDHLDLLGANVLGSPAATYGLWVVIPPLSKGDHTIELAGNNGAGFELDFTIDVEALLIVYFRSPRYGCLDFSTSMTP